MHAINNRQPAEGHTGRSRLSPPNLCVFFVAVLIVIGCTRSTVELAEVTGKITMGGQPLKNASVVFTPENGRPSMGGTDEQGYYSLRYTPTTKGARVGSATVEIRTGNTENLREFPETVPAKYNAKSELTTVVKPEPNEINFDLDAK